MFFFLDDDLQHQYVYPILIEFVFFFTRLYRSRITDVNTRPVKVGSSRTWVFKILCSKWYDTLAMYQSTALPCQSHNKTNPNETYGQNIRNSHMHTFYKTRKIQTKIWFFECFYLNKHNSNMTMAWWSPPNCVLFSSYRRYILWFLRNIYIKMFSFLNRIWWNGHIYIISQRSIEACAQQIWIYKTTRKKWYLILDVRETAMGAVQIYDKHNHWLMANDYIKFERDYETTNTKCPIENILTKKYLQN